MMYALFSIIALAIVAVIFVFLRKPATTIDQDVAAMSNLQRAKLLVNATVFRMTWEADNPQYAGVFLDSRSFPPEIGDRVFSMLMDLIHVFRRERNIMEQRLKQFGIPNEDLKLFQNTDLLMVGHLWMGTVGTQLGKIRNQMAARVWQYLRESAPHIVEALRELEGEHKAARELDASHTFLNDLPIRQVAYEAIRWPTFTS
jgi:hypothetical protein